ncbi:MAG: ATP-dependent helicase [Anaerolineae bacterium]
MDVLGSLNPAQRQAVLAVDGPVLVLAGPGSGKTRVLTHRIAYMVRERGVSPYRILAATFTNKAAREMLLRLERLLGETRGLTVGTFHAFCARLLRQEAAAAGIRPNYVILDADEQLSLITRLAKQLNLDPKQYPPRSIQSAISRAKNASTMVNEYQPPTYWHEAVERVWEAYEEIKKTTGGLDFDDLLLLAERLLRDNAEVRARYQNRYQYVLVDEFQDTNQAQYDLVTHLGGERQNVFVVGDEDQSIYSWRGADYRNVSRFRSTYPEAEVFLLEQNYRSSQSILDVARAVIASNPHRTPKKLWTENSSGPKVQLHEAFDERDEAEYVVDEIIRLVRQEGACRFADCAVMFRTNAQSRSLEDALMRRGIRYVLVGGTRFYQRREIKDLIAYLRLLLNPCDELALARVMNVPPRGIGRKTAASLGQWAHSLRKTRGEALLHLASLAAAKRDGAQMPFDTRTRRALVPLASLLADLHNLATTQGALSRVLTEVIERTAYVDYLNDGGEDAEDRIDNVRELVAATQGYDALEIQQALPAFLEQVALVADVDELDDKNSMDAVTLLTLHAAKGLEFYAVFMVGMEEGLCPHARSMNDDQAMREERRLCYVGITRAKRHLALVRTFRRSRYGRSEPSTPSRFLADIPTSLLAGHVVQPTVESAPRSSISRPSVSRRRAIVDRARQRHQASSSTPGPPTRPKEADAPVVRPLKRRPAPLQAPQETAREPRFGPGDKVTHEVFGKGTVISSRVVDGDEEVTVAFPQPKGVKRLMASYAKLEPA